MKYETPEMKVIYLEQEDVLTTSMTNGGTYDETINDGLDISGSMGD